MVSTPEWLRDSHMLNRVGMTKGVFGMTHDGMKLVLLSEATLSLPRVLAWNEAHRLGEASFVSAWIILLYRLFLIFPPPIHLQLINYLKLFLPSLPSLFLSLSLSLSLSSKYFINSLQCSASKGTFKYAQHGPWESRKLHRHLELPKPHFINGEDRRWHSILPVLPASLKKYAFINRWL